MRKESSMDKCKILSEIKLFFLASRRKCIRIHMQLQKLFEPNVVAVHSLEQGGREKGCSLLYDAANSFDDALIYYLIHKQCNVL